ncbi:MAG: 4Fe-4S dicluster domain-containing protein [Crenarchaeota archaeon]|nr:4Fe-4S dicluster domain-containing protein [Thermoproteota archaeon]
MPKCMRLLLSTGRTIEQGYYLERFGRFSREYLEAISTLYMNPADVEKLGLRDRSVVKVRGQNGREVRMYVKIDSSVPEGVAYAAYGAIINMVVSTETEAAATPNYKQVPVEVCTEENTGEDIVEQYVKIVEKIPGIGDRTVKRGDYKRVRAVCPFCGLLCDNIIVKMIGEEIIDVEEACVIGRAKFVTYHKERILKPLRRRENGELVEIDLERALDEAANILAESRYPLMYGWSCTTCEAIRIGLRLAELIGAVVDNTSSVCHGPTMMAVAETGHSDFTLGFTPHYADLVIFWGWNPSHAHPNFTYRFVNREGKLVEGRKGRKIVIIDVRNVAPLKPTEIDLKKCTGCDLCADACPEIIRKRAGKLGLKTYEIDVEKCRECGLCIRICPVEAFKYEKDVDLHLRVFPGRDYELLTAIRMCLRDLEIEKDNVGGIDKEVFQNFCEDLRRAKYIVLFFGVGLTHSRGKFKNIEEAIKTIQELNEHTKAIIIAMRGHFNVTGSNMVFLWTYGAPFGIDLSKRYPRYIPGVTTAVDILRRGETDAVLVAGADPAASFPKDAVEHFNKIPLILLTPKLCETLKYADIIIPVALTGIECEGTAYRLDAIPIRLKKLVDPPPGVLSDFEILHALYDRVSKLLRR